MGRKVSELDLVTSIGQNNELVIKQGSNTKRVQYSTVVNQVSGVAQAVASAAVVAASNALRDDVTSLRARVSKVSIQASENVAAITSVQAITSKNLAAITSVQAITSKNLVAITSVQAITSKNAAAVTSVQAITSKNAVAVTSVQAITSKNAAAITSVQAMVSKTSVALRDDIVSLRALVSKVSVIAEDAAGANTITSANLTTLEDQITSVQAMVSKTSISLQDEVNTNTAAITSVQALISNTSVALRDDITSIRTKHTSVVEQVSKASVGITADIRAVSAALRDDISSIRSKHTSVTTYLTNLSAQQIAVPNLSGSTYTKVQETLRLNHSSGVIIGGQIKDDGDGTYTVSAGIGAIRSEASIGSELYLFDWAAESGTNVSTADETMVYFYVEYNGGTPRVYTTIAESTDYFTKAALGTAFRYGTDVHITDYSKAVVGDHAVRMLRRMNAVMPFARESGGILTESGTRNIAVTAGTWWEGLNQFTTDAKDTSGADTFQTYYRDGSGGWTETLSETQISDTQYDDGSGTLQTLSNNRYGVHWVYLAVDSDIYVIYGQGNYTLTEAQEAARPSTLPPHLAEDHARLIGKIIIAKSASTFLVVESAFDTTFETAVPTEHNSLQNLQGGVTGEYYHLTEAQHTDLVSVAAVVSKNTVNIATNVAAITSVQALTATNLAAITSVQAMVSKTSIALRDDITSINTEIANSVARLDGNNSFQNNELNQYSLTVETTAGSFTPVSADSGKIITLTNSASIFVNLAKDMPLGWNMSLVQLGTGTVVVSAQASVSLVNTSAHTKLNNYGSGAGLVVVKQEGTNSHAWYMLQGETKA